MNRRRKEALNIKKLMEQCKIHRTRKTIRKKKNQFILLSSGIIIINVCFRDSNSLILILNNTLLESFRFFV